MRNPDLPQHFRIKMAEAAAPFVHRKPTENNPQILAPRHVALLKAVDKGKSTASGAADAKSGKSRAPSTAILEGQSPLEYLVSVMRDPDTAADVRVRIARTVAPFAHPKRKRDPKADQAEAELADALGDEFMVDPEAAAKIHEETRRHEKLVRGRVTRAPEQAQEEAFLQARI